MDASVVLLELHHS